MSKEPITIAVNKPARDKELKKCPKKTCSQCEFFNPDGAYLHTTHRQNGQIYSQHVVRGSVCHVDGVERSRKGSDFICINFSVSRPADAGCVKEIAALRKQLAEAQDAAQQENAGLRDALEKLKSDYIRENGPHPHTKYHSGCDVCFITQALDGKPISLPEGGGK